MAENLNAGTVQFSFIANTSGLRTANGDMNNLTTRVRNAGRATDRLTNQLRRNNETAKVAGKNTSLLSGHMTDLSKSVQVALGPLSGVASRLNAIASLANRNTAVIAGLVTGMIAFFSVAKKAAAEASNFEVEMLRMEVRMAGMGDQFQLSTDQLDQFAKKYGRDTLGSASEARKVMTTLSSAVELTGDQFKKATVLSRDLADSGFGSVETNARRLAQILNDPRDSLDQLRRMGITFTDSQKEGIKAIAEFGDKSVAVEIILAKLEERFGGVSSAAGDTLPGIWDTLAERINEFLQVSVTTVGALDGLKKGLNVVVVAIENLLDNDEAVRNMGIAFELVFTMSGNAAAFFVTYIKEILIGIGLLVATPLPKYLGLVTKLLYAALVPLVSLATRSLALATVLFTLSSSFKYLVDQVPAFKTAMEGLVDSITDIIIPFKDTFESISGFAEEKLSNVLDWVGAASAGFDRLRAGMKKNTDMKALDRKVAGGGIDTDAAAQERIRIVADHQKSLDLIAMQQGDFTSNVKDSITNNTKEALVATKEFSVAFGENFKDMLDGNNEILNSAFKDHLPALITQGRADLESLFNIDISKMSAEFQSKFDAWLTGMAKSSGRATVKTKKDFASLGSTIEEEMEKVRRVLANKELFEGLQSAAEKAFDGIGKALTDAIFEGKDAFLALNNVAKSVAADILNTYVKLAVANPIKNALFGGLKGVEPSPVLGGSSNPLSGIGSFIKGIFGGGGAAAASSGVSSSAISSGLGSGLGATFTFAKGGIMTPNGSVPLKTYANGGIATSPQAAIFGEGSQNEAFVPLPDGKSIPVDLRNSQASNGVNITINIDASGSASERGGDASNVTELARMISGLVSREIQTQQRPGGLLAS